MGDCAPAARSPSAPGPLSDSAAESLSGLPTEPLSGSPAEPLPDSPADSARGAAGPRDRFSSSPESLAGPLTFEPRYRDYVWGGRNLARLLGRDLPSGIVAESWEISAHPAAPTSADSEPFRGRTLLELAAEHGEALVGRNAESAFGQGRFPLLVKLLDAAEPLSVQVHPDDARAARRRDGELGKTEMWHVLHAVPGAEVVLGLREGTDERALRRAWADGRIEECLNRAAVHAGDSILVPAGTVHAILGGAVLLEVQQNSDITYRLHDWGRTDADGNPRQLHLEEAIDAIDFAAPTPRVRPLADRADASDGTDRQVLANCPAFVVERLRLPGGVEIERRVAPGSCEVWGVLEGRALISPTNPARALALPAVRFALLPAAMGDFSLRTDGGAVAVRAYVPPPPQKCPARDSNPEPAD